MTSLSESQRTGPHRGLVFAAATAVAVAVVLAVLQPRADQARAKTPASQPAPVVHQLELVHAETFQVEQPYPHYYRADTPLVRSGWLLVLAGDPALLQVRQTRMPVLYVGAQTAERVNTGQESGKIVVLVPGDFRLQDAPIFFGSPALPEDLRQNQIDAELANARAEGAVPPTAAAIAKALGQGRTYANDWELRQRAIDLVEQYSPVEKELIAGCRVPLVK
jgi:hypothetical protein